MKMADKNIGAVGFYKHNGLNNDTKFWDYMRIGCDIGRHLFTTKSWTAMISHDSKITKSCNYLYQLTIGNVRYLWNNWIYRGI